MYTHPCVESPGCYTLPDQADLMRFEFLVVVATAFLSLALVSGAARGEVGVTDKEIVIGSCVPLSGEFAWLGKATIEGGARPYLEYINDKGGVRGRRIRLVANDDRYDPEIAIACFNQLLGEGIFAGGFFSSTGGPSRIVPMAEHNKVPLIGFASAPSFLYDPFKRYVFGLRIPYDRLVDEIVDHLWYDLGIRKIGIIMQENALGGEGRAALIDALNRHGATLAGVGSISVKSKSADQAIESLKAAHPEAILVALTSPVLGQAIRQMRAEGIDSLLFTFSGLDEYFQDAGEPGEGLIATRVTPPLGGPPSPAIELYRSVLKKYAPEMKPSNAGLEGGFLPAVLLVEALQRAGPELTREKLVDALESIREYDVGLGPEYKVSFTPHSHMGFSHIAFVVNRHGKPTPFTDWKALSRPAPAK